jgi:hypothetical protein
MSGKRYVGTTLSSNWCCAPCQLMLLVGGILLFVFWVGFFALLLGLL